MDLAVNDQPKAVDVATLDCIECGRHWNEGSDRWRAYVTADEPRQVIIYCDWCAEREFGE